jgi:hypothetical protein
MLDTFATSEMPARESTRSLEGYTRDYGTRVNNIVAFLFLRLTSANPNHRKLKSR